MSSNDGYDSDSPEADPLHIQNDSLDSNENPNESTSKSEIVGKKRKKRSPVCVYDHITILSGDPQLYQCNVCEKKFKTKAHIKYHEFCQNGEKPYKCEQCGQGFIAKSHFEYHLRTHTGERPFVCPKCGKGFNQQGKVTRHMRSHTGEKPFICAQCGRGFSNAQALRSHFLIHTGERPYECKYCLKRFTGLTNLKKHTLTHTGEKPFGCSHCDKSFALKWTLDLHMRTHSTERPFACDQCTRAFSNSKDLRRHLVIHTGERPYKCWICGTAFRRKDNLDRHIKNTHGQSKEVAKHLANEAEAEYRAINAKISAEKASGNESTQGQSKEVAKKPHKAVAKYLANAANTSVETASGNESPQTSKESAEDASGSEERNAGDIKDQAGVVITADLSPPASPAISVGAPLLRDYTSQDNSADTLHSSSNVSTRKKTILNVARSQKPNNKKATPCDVQVNQIRHVFGSSESPKQTGISKSSSRKKEDTSGEPIPCTSQNCLMVSSICSTPNKTTPYGEIQATQVKRFSITANSSTQSRKSIISLPKKRGPSGKTTSTTSLSYLNNSSTNDGTAQIQAFDETEAIPIKNVEMELLCPQETSQSMNSMENSTIKTKPGTSRSISNVRIGNKRGSVHNLSSTKAQRIKKAYISWIRKYSKLKRGNPNSSQRKPTPNNCSIMGRNRKSVIFETKSNIKNSQDTADINALPSSDLLREKKSQETIESQIDSEDTSSQTTNEVPDKAARRKMRKPIKIYNHIKTLDGERTLYKCLVCSKVFKTKAHIKYHEFCQNGEKPYKCEQCGQGFIAKSHFEYHIRTHTGVRPYPCPKCGKRFNQRGKVTRHMRSHTGEKPFVCAQCGRGFSNAQALRSHFLIHTGERPYECKYCLKRFTGLTNLKKHTITHTGERPFGCTICGKAFGLKWTLDLHLQTHSAERPFACNQCPRAFSNSKDLRRHSVIHSGERPFKCWICGTAFRRKDNLDRHIKNTHGQPKEIAKQLADEAAAEYLANLTQTSNSPTKPTATNSVESEMSNSVGIQTVDEIPNSSIPDQTELPASAEFLQRETVIVDGADVTDEGITGQTASESTFTSDDTSVAGTASAEVKSEIPMQMSPSASVDLSIKSEALDFVPFTPSEIVAMSGEKRSLDKLGVIITAESSPPQSPQSIFTVTAHEESYILPDCQSDVQSNIFKEDVETTERQTQVDAQEYDDDDLLSYTHLQYFQHIS